MTVPTAEDRRIAALTSLDLLVAKDNEHRLDRVLQMAAEFFAMQAGAVILAGRRELVFKSRYGFTTGDTLLSGSFTEAVMSSHPLLVVEDASRDPRFSGSPLVAGEPFVRLFIGQPLHAPGGELIGAFAMASNQPRSLSEEDQRKFQGVGSWIEEELARESELTRARQVQQALQPKTSLVLDGYEIAGSSTPARTLGGDFFDWYPVPHGIGFTVADVMGKGLGASVIAATVRAVIRSGARSNGVVTAVTRAAEILDHDLGDTDTFATLFHAKLRGSDGRVRYVDAGHGLTLVVRVDGTWTRLAHGDLPLGTAFGHTWRRHTVRLNEGDTLITFSDGVLDIFDGTLDSLGDVVDIVRHTSSAQRAVAAITLMAEHDNSTDDVVVLAIRRLEP